MTSSMAWGGFKNGAIPVTNLVEFDGTGKFLQADAASSLTRLFDATQKATGARPYIAAWQDLNRDLAEQITLLGQNYTAVTSGSYAFSWNGKKWRKTGPITCAKPGTSNHGWARAGDITFPTSASRAWFRAHCTEYDWTNAGDAFGEDWHKEYHGPITTTAGTGTRIEDDMQKDEREALFAVKAALLDGRPETGMAKGALDVIYEGTRDVQGRMMAATGGAWDAFDELIKNTRGILALAGKNTQGVVDVAALAAAIRKGLGDELADILAQRLTAK